MMDPTPPAGQANRLVVLIHGFGASRWLMTLMQRRLRRDGFRTVNWGYPSLFAPVGRHVDRLCETLERQCPDEAAIDVVAHSMGSIIVRAALARSLMPRVHRMVMLAPPNAGSPIARIGESTVGRICKPISDLSDRDQSFVNRLPTPIEIEVGILAARFDNLVPLSCTYLAGQADHLVLPATHSSLLFSKRAARQTAHFLRTGRFQHRV